MEKRASDLDGAVGRLKRAARTEVATERISGGVRLGGAQGEGFGDGRLWRADQVGEVGGGLYDFHGACGMGVAIIGKAVHRKVVDAGVIDIPRDAAGLGEDMGALFGIALMLV